MLKATVYEQLPAVKAPEIEIYYKTTLKAGQRFKVLTCQDIYNIMFDIGEMNRNLEYKEMFYSLYMNNNSELLAVHKISEGTTDTAPVDIKFIMQGAIMTNAATLIVCHNHPSGNTSPSQADRKLTERIKQAAALFGVKLMDSIIITTTNYYSFAAEGIL